MERFPDPYIQASEAFARSAAELLAPAELEAVLRAAQANSGALGQTHEWANLAGALRLVNGGGQKFRQTTCEMRQNSTGNAMRS